jgi:amino acid adenylation domain-containing protein/thioester reductase-like protein
MNFKQALALQLQKQGSRSAIVTPTQTISYDTLNRHAHAVMAQLPIQGIVALYFEKSVEYLTALTAVSLSDCAFLPIEISAPNERIHYILNDAKPRYLITSKHYDAQTLNKIPQSITRLYIEDMLTAPCLAIPRTYPVAKDELAYCIYTSGSTGRPKGTLLSFNGLSAIILQQIQQFKIQAQSRFYLYLAINFDASLSDIYCSFMAGATLYLDDSLRKDITRLTQQFSQWQITHSDLPPSLLKLLSPIDFPSLKSLVIGGEVADIASVQAFAKQCHVSNVYGPTEATICTSFETCTEHWQQPSLGKPVEGTQYFVVNQGKLVTDAFVTGELYISGCQLAIGYLNLPELTKAHFITFNKQRCYRTGDLVQYDEIGNLLFRGRTDRQIKYHGQLINLEEVENALRRIPAVTNVSVIFKAGKLAGYYEGSITNESLRDQLSDQLPYYMIPSLLINQHIPKNSTGKNDNKALENISIDCQETQALVSLFQTILNNTELLINNNDQLIQDLGGDSLDFIKLHLALEQRGYSISHDQLIVDNSINGILKHQGNSHQGVSTHKLAHKLAELPALESHIAHDNQTNNVFVTGVSGFLGAHWVNTLCNTYPEKTFYCLVRASSDKHAKDRLVNHFDKIGLSYPEDNVIAIAGDLTHEQFGRKKCKFSYAWLSKCCDEIIHCAAHVNNILSHKQLWSANVEATAAVAAFALNENKKTMHYASTLSVYVSQHRDTTWSPKEDTLTNDGTLLNSGYAQSKWAAEYWLTTAFIKAGGDVRCYRFGLLTPDSQGEYFPTNSFLAQCIKELSALKITPTDHIGLAMDITPIDAAIAAIVPLHKNAPAIFHVSTNWQLSLTTLGKQLGCRTIDTESWFARFKHKLCSQFMTDLNNPYSKQANMNLFETTFIDHFETTHPDETMQIWREKANKHNYIQRLIEKYRQ